MVDSAIKTGGNSIEPSLIESEIMSNDLGNILLWTFSLGSYQLAGFSY
jgi:hypothetical protein